MLRKFFRTRLGAVIPVDVVEALMGHEGYLTEFIDATVLRNSPDSTSRASLPC